MLAAQLCSLLGAQVIELLAVLPAVAGRTLAAMFLANALATSPVAARVLLSARVRHDACWRSNPSYRFSVHVLHECTV